VRRDAADSQRHNGGHATKARSSTTTERAAPPTLQAIGLNAAGKDVTQSLRDCLQSLLGSGLPQAHRLRGTAVEQVLGAHATSGSS